MKKVVEDFRKKKRFVNDLNNTIIALIPKRRVEKALKIIGPFLFVTRYTKLLQKTLAIKYKRVLDKIKSEEQNSFVPRRKNIGNIIIAHEVVHMINKERIRGMLVKIEISKAYDHVNWHFLLVVLEKIGFCSD